MATVDLGKIKMVFRGAYNNATAYTPDDVVTSGGTSYICILASTGNAVTNTTYWNVLAQGGTDLSTILTTQGDTVVRGASGLERLAIGQAGEALKVNSSANGFEFGSAGKNIVAKAFYNSSALGSSTDLVNLNITAASANPTLHVMGVFAIGTRSTGNLDDENIHMDMKYSTDGGSSYTTAQADVYKCDVYAPGQDDTHNNAYDTHLRQACQNFQVTCSAGTVINVVVRLDYSHVNNSRTIYINRNENGSSGRQGSHLIIYEQ
jgi:hypothetical protein|tara:strand:- start:1103 stop:1891 length:789 start_codon:yes stop_codon:yes gene_type:complete